MDDPAFNKPKSNYLPYAVLYLIGSLIVGFLVFIFINNSIPAGQTSKQDSNLSTKSAPKENNGSIVDDSDIDFDNVQAYFKITDEYGNPLALAQKGDPNLITLHEDDGITVFRRYGIEIYRSSGERIHLINLQGLVEEIDYEKREITMVRDNGEKIIIAIPIETPIVKTLYEASKDSSSDNPILPKRNETEQGSLPEIEKGTNIYIVEPIFGFPNGKIEYYDFK